MTRVKDADPRLADGLDFELVVAELRATRKSRDLAPALLARVAREALLVAPRRADAVKRAKSKLHQIHSAFLPERALADVGAQVARLATGTDPAEIGAICTAILTRHVSTSERPRELAALYRELFALTGAPSSILDLGCGLHPFALPWMGLARDVRYDAIDVNLRMVALITTLFRALGQRGAASAADLLSDDPLPAADVVFLMKLLPTLERQRKGAAAKLLDRIEARALVLSFPTTSLGGRAKGMEHHYSGFARELIASRGGSARTLSTPTELFFVVTAPRRRA